jgi:hypothetical protein
MILSKYDSDADVYQYYQIEQDTVRYGRYFLNGQKRDHIRRWNHTVQELGWTSNEHYIEHLKKLGYREVKSYESIPNFNAAIS